MKRIILLIVIIVESLQFSHGQTNIDISTDTLFSIILTDVRGVSYKIIQTIDLSNDYWIDSTRKIIVYYEDKKAIICLPIPDEDVKNFSIENVSRNFNGFTLIISQGGDPIMIRRFFFFKVVHHQLYFFKILSEYESIDSRKIEKKYEKIHPKIIIDEFDLVPFL